MSHARKPLAGQLDFKFMSDRRRGSRPKLVVVRAEPEDQPAGAKPGPRRRLPKAG